MKLKVLASDEEDSPWFADGLTFTCTQCGNCCTGAPGYVWVSDVEIDRLAAHLNLTRDEILERYCRRIGNKISLKEHRSPAGLYDCIFLKEIPVPASAPQQDDSTVMHTKRVCTIYSVRPLQCRTWPFWDGLLASKKQWDDAGKRCPGINIGNRKFAREQIEALRDATDWPQNPPSSAAKTTPVNAAPAKPSLAKSTATKMPAATAATQPKSRTAKLKPKKK